jgi:transcriptional regulator with XRE-family HTH domain
LIKINAAAACRRHFAAKGCAMDSRPTDPPDRKGLDAVFAAIAVWVMKYRYALGMRNEMMKCRPEDVERLAREMRVHPSELAGLATKNEQSAALLEKLLRALGVEPGKLAHRNPLLMRDLQRLCIACVAKRRCELELAEGTAAENFREYCPNAFTLDALLKSE